VTESVITVETATRAIVQMRAERDFAIAALKKIEAILLTPLLKGNGYAKQRAERMLAITQDTCANLAARATV
jgi:endonuclease III-like uncharacterized protein